MSAGTKSSVRGAAVGWVFLKIHFMVSDDYYVLRASPCSALYRGSIRIREGRAFLPRDNKSGGTDNRRDDDANLLVASGDLELQLSFRRQRSPCG